MPYIIKERRLPWDELDPETSGELNYYFTKLCKVYLGKHGFSYKTFNDIIGALESAKLEFYRRIAAPYENDKCEKNGDVF